MVISGVFTTLHILGAYHSTSGGMTATLTLECFVFTLCTTLQLTDY
jgi:hypothetical protein